jgi:hypothetical protein
MPFEATRFGSFVAFDTPAANIAAMMATARGSWRPGNGVSAEASLASAVPST